MRPHVEAACVAAEKAAGLKATSGDKARHGRTHAPGARVGAGAAGQETRQEGEGHRHLVACSCAGGAERDIERVNRQVGGSRGAGDARLCCE